MLLRGALGLLWKDILFQTEHLFTYNILFQVSPMLPPHPPPPFPRRPLEALCGCQYSRQDEAQWQAGGKPKEEE